jgi:hypothetical protein
METDSSLLLSSSFWLVDLLIYRASRNVNKD